MCILSTIPFCLILVKYSCCTIVSLTTNGTTILGRELKTLFGNQYYVAFYNIPYAEPPVGELRFKPPVNRQWFNQNNYNYSKPYENFSEYTEDCLYLTVYTPHKESRVESYAVSVWLHENSDLDGPDFLIDEDIIVITVSFRSSILGFLNTQDEFSGGNMGAKDILSALKWIRNNIIYFNGDPNRVTVIGSGIAANIVASFPLSPLAEDLFSRVVIQSGSALSPIDYHSYNFEILNKLFWNFYGPTKKFNRKKLYERLQEASIKKLQFISKNVFDSTEVRDNQRLINAFGPSIETSSKNVFMSELPLEMYKKGKINKNVQIMMGFTSLESIHELKGFVDNRKLLTYLNYNFQYLVPFEGRKDEYESQRYKKIRRKIMDFYFVNGTIREQSLRRYAKYLSDQVIHPVLRQARLHTETTRDYVYLYRFSHKGSLNMIWDVTLNNLNMSGATTGDEICYQFRCKYLDDIYKTIGENEREFIKKMARLLANYVKFGNPTPTYIDETLGNIKWNPLSPNQNKTNVLNLGNTVKMNPTPTYIDETLGNIKWNPLSPNQNKINVLNLGNTVKMLVLPERKRMEFWDDLHAEYFSGEKLLHDEL